MKILFVCGAFGEPYKVEISDDLLQEARSAQRVLNYLPWNGRMFLECPVEPLKDICGTYLNEKIDIVVGKRSVWLECDGPEGREMLLNPSDNLLTIDDLYVSKNFEAHLLNNMFDLDSDEMELIITWRERKWEKLKEYPEDTDFKVIW